MIGELLLIVEYCRYGNLQNYFVKNKKNFFNLENESITNKSNLLETFYDIARYTETFSDYYNYPNINLINT